MFVCRVPGISIRDIMWYMFPLRLHLLALNKLSQVVKTLDLKCFNYIMMTRKGSKPLETILFFTLIFYFIYSVHLLKLSVDLIVFLNNSCYQKDRLVNSHRTIICVSTKYRTCIQNDKSRLTTKSTQTLYQRIRIWEICSRQQETFPIFDGSETVVCCICFKYTVGT